MPYDPAVLEMAGVKPPEPIELDESTEQFLGAFHQRDQRRRRYLRRVYAAPMIDDFKANRREAADKALRELTAPDDRRMVLEELEQVARRKGLNEQERQQARGFFGRWAKNLGRVGIAFTDAAGDSLEAMDRMRDVVPRATGAIDPQADVQFRQAAEGAVQELAPTQGLDAPWTQRTAAGAAAMTPDLAAGMLAGSAAGPGAAATYWAARSQPEIRDDLVAMGLSPGEAELAAAGTAAAIGGLEAVQVDPTGTMKRTLARPIRGKARQLFTKGAKKLAGEAGEKLARNPYARRAAGAGVEAFKRTGIETGEEFAQGAVEAAAGVVASRYSDTADDRPWSEIGQTAAAQAKEAAGPIAILGGAGGAGQFKGSVDRVKRLGAGSRKRRLEVEIMEAARQGVTPTRKQWAAWGLPKSAGLDVRKRRRKLVQFAREIQARDQAQHLLRGTTPTADEWATWGLPAMESAADRRQYLERMLRGEVVVDPRLAIPEQAEAMLAGEPRDVGLPDGGEPEGFVPGPKAPTPHVRRRKLEPWEREGPSIDEMTREIVERVRGEQESAAMDQAKPMGPHAGGARSVRPPSRPRPWLMRPKSTDQQPRGPAEDLPGLSPDEVAEVWATEELAKHRNPGSFERKSINQEKVQLRRLAKRLDGWRTADALTAKSRQGKTNVRRTADWLKRLRELGYVQVAWDAEGNAYYARKGEAVPSHLSTELQEVRGPHAGGARPVQPSLQPQQWPMGPKPSTREVTATESMGGQGAGRIQDLPTDQINVDPARFQFKTGVSDTGVVEGEELAGDWNPAAAGVILVWQDADGRYWAVNGHHRTDLAKRKGAPTMAARVVREADGVTANEARAMGAELNILEGQGKVEDYAQFFRETQVDEEEAERRGLLARAKGKAGFMVGRFASEDVWAAYRGRKVSAEKAAAIADIGRDDEGLQSLGLTKARSLNADELRSFLKVLKLYPRQAASQGDLFGFDDSAIVEAEQTAEAVAAIVAEKKERLLAVRGALKRPEAAKKMGLAGDFESIRKEVDRLQGELLRWSRWETDPELVREARQRAGLPADRDGGPLKESRPSRRRSAQKPPSRKQAGPLSRKQAVRTAGKMLAGRGKMPPRTELVALVGETVTQREAGDLLQAAGIDDIPALSEAFDLAERHDDAIPIGRVAVLAKKLAKIADTSGRLAEAQKQVGDANVIELALEGDDRGRRIVIHQSTYTGQEGRWQLTQFDKDGPVGHENYDTRDDALASAIGAGRVGFDVGNADYKVSQTVTMGQETKVRKFLDSVRPTSSKSGKVDPYVDARRADKALRNPLAKGQRTVKSAQSQQPKSFDAQMARAPDAKTQRETEDRARRSHEMQVKVFGDDHRPVSARQMVRRLEQIWETELHRGRTGRRGVRGYYHPAYHAQRIATDSASNVTVAMHELAHRLDHETDVLDGLSATEMQELRRLDYYPNRPQANVAVQEGFAEFVRAYVTGSLQEGKLADLPRLAPRFSQKFAKWLAANPDVKQKLADSIEAVESLRSTTAAGRVMGQISTTGVDERIKPNWRTRLWGVIQRTYMRVKDEGYGLGVATKEARARGYVPRRGDIDPHAWFNAMRNAGPNFAAQAAEKGVFSLHDMRRLGASMKEVLAEIKPGDDYNRFLGYAYARHAIEAWDHGTNPGIHRVDAEAALAELYDERYERAADSLTDFNNSLLEMMAEVGAMDSSLARQLANYYQTYIPLTRAVDKGSLPGGMTASYVNMPAPLRRRFGADLQILDPVESSLRRAVQFYELASRQVVVNKLVEMMRRTPGPHRLGDWIYPVDPKKEKTSVRIHEVERSLRDAIARATEDPDAAAELVDLLDPLDELWKLDPESGIPHGEPGVVRVLRDGQAQYYQIAPLLLESLGGMNPHPTFDVATRTIGALTKMVKAGATRFNPDFILSNAFRDWQTFLLQGSKGGVGAFDPARAATAYMASELGAQYGREKDRVVDLWQQMGGELSTYIGLDRPMLRRAIHRSTEGKPRWADTLLSVAGTPEVAPRIAEFAAVLQREGWLHRVQAGETPPMAVLAQAINAAHDVTVDFRRMGQWGRYLNQWLPFFNARLEGLDKFVRTWRDNPSRTLARVASQRIPMALAYWWYRHDDDDYRERPKWQDQYWVFTDTHGNPMYRIPRPHEWGLIDAGVERMLDAMWDNSPDAVSRWFEQAMGAMNPGSYPAGITTAAELVPPQGFSTFRWGPIVPRNLMALEPQERYSDRTAKVAVAAARFLHAMSRGKVAVSPMKIEHLAEGLTGGLSRKVTGLAELPFQEKWSANDAPGLGSVTLRTDYWRSISDFYDTRDRMAQQVQTGHVRDRLVPAEVQWQHHKLQHAGELVSELGRLQRDLPSSESRAVKRLQAAVARQVLGRPPLESFPNPLADPNSAPASVRDAIWEHIGRRANAAATPRHVDPGVRDAERYLREMGVSESVAAHALARRLSEQRLSVESRADRVQRLKSRL